MFFNYAAGDYRPSATMPVGTDGKPMGGGLHEVPGAVRPKRDPRVRWFVAGLRGT